MERMAEIKLTKSVLFIPERILWQYIPPEEIEEGIRRGKQFKRQQRVLDYECKRKTLQI